MFCVKQCRGTCIVFLCTRGVSQTLDEIVFSLLPGLLGQGYHVYNYYNSVGLAKQLYDQKVHCTGTLRLARGAPPSLKDLQRNRIPRNSYHHRRKDNTLIMCWYDNRLVSLITTFHGVDTEVYQHKKRVHRQGHTELQMVTLDRPVAIWEYTKYMQGVDRLDEFMKYYSFLWKTKRWTKKILFYFLQIALQNAYALYQKYTTNRTELTHFKFHMAAIGSLIHFDPAEWPVTGSLIPHAPNLPQPQAAMPPAPGTPRSSPDSDSPPPRTPHQSPPQPTPGPSRKKKPRLVDPPQRLQSFKKHVLTAIKGPGNKPQKQCRVCYMISKRKDTTKECIICKIPLCTKDPCFDVYHKKMKYWTTPTLVQRRESRGRGRQQE